MRSVLYVRAEDVFDVIGVVRVVNSVADDGSQVQPRLSEQTTRRNNTIRWDNIKIIFPSVQFLRSITCIESCRLTSPDYTLYTIILSIQFKPPVLSVL